MNGSLETIFGNQWSTFESSACCTQDFGSQVLKLAQIVEGGLQDVTSNRVKIIRVVDYNYYSKTVQ